MYAGALLGLDVQVAKDDETLNEAAWSTIFPKTFIRRVKFKIGFVPAFIDIYNAVYIKTTGWGTGNIRAIGPGFWYDNSILMGIRYSRRSGWSMIRDRTLTLMTRKPSFSLTGPLHLKV